MAVYKHPKTGRWVAQTSIAGRKRQVGTFGTQKEAKQAIKDAEARIVGPDMTIAEWRLRWLATPEWKESTRIHNTAATASFTTAHGHLRMTDLSRATARDWVRAHPSSHGALSAMFGAAVYDDVLPTNTFSRLVKRTVHRRDLQPDWLNDEDITGLERAALRHHGPIYGPSFAAMIRFAAETGVRSGELFALRHGDLDVEAGALYVRRAADSKSRTITTPKNGTERQIVLSARAAQAAEQALRFDGTDRVFSTVRGKQFWLPSMSWAWRPVATGANRSGMEFYELRHFCATRLLEMGLSDADVALQLGHTDGGELVRRVYGHPSERQARERLRDAMDGREAA